MYSPAAATAAAFPTRAAFAVASPPVMGGASRYRSLYGYRPAPACYSLRAALVATGATPARVAARLAAAYADSMAGKPIAWPANRQPA